MTLPKIRSISPPAFRALSALLFVWLPAMGLAVAADAEPKPLTNADVIKMLDNKVPESIILSKIQASETKFDNSTDAIIELTKKGVSEKIQNAMVNPKGSSEEGAKSGAVKPPDAPAPPPAATPGEKKDPLSYGTATGLVKKGVTTQLEIMNLFGGADVMTTDKDGTEVWMYDKKTSTVSSSSASSRSEEVKSEASQMAAYLGIPFVAGVGGAKEKGKTETTGTSQNQGEYKSSSKTITFCSGRGFLGAFLPSAKMVKGSSRKRGP